MRTNDLFLTAAAASMMMLAACTHDDGTTSISEPTPVGNELIISTRHSEMGITRAESNIQENQFKSGEYIDVFMQDATRSSETDTTGYDSPVRYKADGSGNLATYSYTTSTGRIYDENIGRPLYWPKKMHDLHIYGVYPVGSVGFVPHKTNCTDAATYNSELKAFDNNFKYYFTVQEDQTSEANYKKSDLMIGLPSTYEVNSLSKYTAPFLLDQVENPGTISLTFTHRLTKIVVNITRTDETTDIDMNDIWYDETATNPADTKYAVVTLENVVKKTWFCVDNTDEVAASRVVVGADGVDAQPVGTTIIVGKGKTHLTDNSNSLTLSAIVPPQTITGSEISPTHFIKVQLYDGELITNTFYYDLKANLTLLASKVYTFNIRINKPNIIVTTEINVWAPGGTTNAIGVLQ